MVEIYYFAWAMYQNPNIFSFIDIHYGKAEEPTISIFGPENKETPERSNNSQNTVIAT